MVPIITDFYFRLFYIDSPWREGEEGVCVAVFSPSLGLLLPLYLYDLENYVRHDKALVMPQGTPECPHCQEDGFLGKNTLIWTQNEFVYGVAVTLPEGGAFASEPDGLGLTNYGSLTQYWRFEAQSWEDQWREAFGAVEVAPPPPTEAEREEAHQARLAQERDRDRDQALRLAPLSLFDDQW
ncbi:hypothetical protein PAPYR_2676 [Paratrimastix pyriformis]|uniref:Uncharacterized protein n=1 Tax=Paratrimastix pyriformis TaxID=342808 RepID=A0ABQ8UPU8_9EUKA|nr:hypothetical protein PAPYR_2676 [Paratrimastix pyriformis]